MLRFAYRKTAQSRIAGMHASGEALLAGNDLYHRIMLALAGLSLLILFFDRSALDEKPG